MALKLSTGMVNGMLGAAASTPPGKGLSELLEDGYIVLYASPRPSSSDSAPTGTKLVTITSDGAAYNYNAGAPTNGLSFGNPAAGVVSKATGETWSGVAAATGAAVWGRFYPVQDPTSAEIASTTAARYDFSVSTSGADLNMSSTSITSGSTVTIDSFSVTLPNGE